MPIQEGGKFSPTQKIVSPGVFTRENDLTISSLAQGVANIGGAVVAPFPDGPAFRPTLITDSITLEQTFGSPDGIYYGPYAAKEYLLQQGAVTIVRVGGLTGYWQKNPLVLYAQPGEWPRGYDAGALTTGSYMFLDSSNYTSNVLYTQSGSSWKIKESLGDGKGSSPDDGVNVSARLTTKSDIVAFLAAHASLANIDSLSSSLGKAYAEKRLVNLTTTNLVPAFNSAVGAAGKVVCQAGGSTNYALAWFDMNHYVPSGSLYFGGGGSVTSHKIDKVLNGYLNINTSTGISGPELKRSFPANSGSYLTASIKQVNGEVNFPFVFLQTSLSNSNRTGSAYSTSDSLVKNRFSLTVANDISELIFSGSVSGEFAKQFGTATTGSNYDGTGTISGSLTFCGRRVSLGQVVTGKLVRFFQGGSLSASRANGNTNVVGFYYLTSSLQGTPLSAEATVAAAIEESTETLYYLSSSILNVPNAAEDLTPSSSLSFTYDRDTFDATSDLNIYSASFKAVRGKDTCAVYLRFLGIVAGPFGAYTGTFEPAPGSEIDPCYVGVTGRKNMVLGVFANTQNASTQFGDDYAVNGFLGSTIAQLTSSVEPYRGNINPLENKYELELKYKIGNDPAGTYGCYQFSLNEADNGYIAEVFGSNPTVGNPAKQMAGAKIEAAYSYVLFEDSIKRFMAEKVRPNNEGGGWRLQVATAPTSGFSIGESMKFVDQYSYDPTSGDSQFSITNARTPWVLSQKTAAAKCEGQEGSATSAFKLFRIHTMNDGTVNNTKYKVEISNVRLAGTVPGSKYGSFTLALRLIDDNEKRPQYIELYQNLNLDPDSPNFIARRIGDKYSYITFGGKTIEYGDYANLSKNIRVEMTDIPYPESSVPYGFEAYSTPVDGTLSTLLPPVRYSKASIYGLNVGKYASGTVFGPVPDVGNELAALYPTSSADAGVEHDTRQYFKPLPYYGGNDQFGDNIDFDLEEKSYGNDNAKYYGQGTSACTGSILDPGLSGSIPSVYDPVNESTYVKLRKFVFGFQGGFDGQWPAIQINVGSDITAGNTQGLDCTNLKSPGTVAYSQAIQALGNSEEYDINLIVLPGIFRDQHAYLTDITIEMCENRGDCFYIMDNVVIPASNQTAGLIDAAIESIKNINSNYVATYYPWVKILDSNNGRVISVPPSVILPSVYASNDKSAAEWYAPAGLNRGGIPQAVQVLDRLNHNERDQLYENRINPIAAFPGQGIVVWGQKTLQVEQSALDRINVRRLLINLKKFVASTSNYLVFEYNIASTRNRFLNIVNPYLESIQSRNGIYSYQIKMDDANNTQDLIDRQIIYGQIYIQPTKVAEYVILDFNVLPSGATFNV